jgi:stringent starvation protein B
MHEWMLDNGFTPCLVVDISPTATRGLILGNDAVTFETRFGGVSQQLVVPIGSVLGIYARETGQSMIFAEDDGTAAAPQGDKPSPDGDKPPPATPGGGRAKLKVVK